MIQNCEMPPRCSNEDEGEVPYTRLTPETLRRVAEDFVTRDGTDYGAVEKTLEDKLATLMRQLERREAAIVFDGESGTVNIVRRHRGGRAT